MDKADERVEVGSPELLHATHARFQFHRLETWKQQEILRKQAEKEKLRKILEEQIKEKEEQRLKEAESERVRVEKEEARLRKDAFELQRRYSLPAMSSARSNLEENEKVDDYSYTSQNDDKVSLDTAQLSHRSNEDNANNKKFGFEGFDEHRKAEFLRKQAEQKQTRKLLEEQLKEKRRRKSLEEQQLREEERRENEKIERQQRELREKYERDTGIRVEPPSLARSNTSPKVEQSHRSNTKVEKPKSVPGIQPESLKSQITHEHEGNSIKEISSLREKVLEQQKLLKEQAKIMYELREQAIVASSERNKILENLKQEGNKDMQKRIGNKSGCRSQLRNSHIKTRRKLALKNRKSDPGQVYREQKEGKMYKATNATAPKGKSKKQNTLNIRSITLKRDGAGKLRVELEEVHERCIIKRIGKTFEHDDRSKLHPGDFIIGLGKFNVRKILQEVETIHHLDDVPVEIPFMKEVQNLFKKAAAMVTIAVCQVPTEAIVSTIQYSEEDDENDEEYSFVGNNVCREDFSDDGLAPDDHIKEVKSPQEVTHEFNSSLLHGSSLIDENFHNPNSTFKGRSLAASSEFFYKDDWSNLENILSKSSSDCLQIQERPLENYQDNVIPVNSFEHHKMKSKHRAHKIVVTPKPNIAAKSLLPSDFFNS